MSARAGAGGPPLTRTVQVLIGLSALLFPQTTPAQPVGESTVTELLSELHRLVNGHRRAAGCEELEWHEATAGVAEGHSRDMSRRDYFDHITPEGTGPSERLLAGGVTWHGSLAENIALTIRGPETVIELWVDSPPHRANLEECSFTHHGLGLFRDRWTQMLVERPDE